MRITLTQAPTELAIGATAVLTIDFGAAVPPMDAAPLVAVAAGAWTKVALGPGLEIKAGVLDLAGGGSGYVLPAATGATRGGVTVGANITLSGDSISLTAANVEAALTYTPIDKAGAAAAAPVQSVAGRTGTVVLSAADVSGLAKVATSGAYADLSGTPAPYTLPAATGATLGGVIVGSNLTVAAGTISLTKGNAIAALGLTPVDAAGAAAAAPVQSVAGRTGAVTLGTADIAGFTAAAGAAAPVQSVGGATGTVALPYGATIAWAQGAVPQPGTITIDGALAGATTIADAVHTVGSAGGTVSFRVQIVSGGVPTSIAGLDAVTTSKATFETSKATAKNTGAAGDVLQLVITGVTGTPADANITIRGTRP